jgi:hypothetical protein
VPWTEASGVQTPSQNAPALKASHHKRKDLRGRHLGGCGVKRLSLLSFFGAAKKVSAARTGVNENKKFNPKLNPR